MKKMQKIIGVLLVVLVAVMALTACPSDNPVNDNGEYITIKIGGDNGLETQQSYLGGVLGELSESGNLHVKFAADTGFGRWLEQIGTLVPNPANQYIALYATTDDMNHVDPLTKKTIDGVTYYYALKGVDAMPIINDTTYLFILESF